MKPGLHGILGLIANTCIIQVRAKTVDELHAGVESPTLQQLIPTFWSPARPGPADSFTLLHPKIVPLH